MYLQKNIFFRKYNPPLETKTLRYILLEIMNMLNITRSLLKFRIKEIYIKLLYKSFKT